MPSLVVPSWTPVAKKYCTKPRFARFFNPFRSSSTKSSLLKFEQHNLGLVLVMSNLKFPDYV